MHSIHPQHPIVQFHSHARYPHVFVSISFLGLVVMTLLANVTRNWIDVPKLCGDGRLEEALDIIEQRDICLQNYQAWSILQECIRTKNWQFGRRAKLFMGQNELDCIAVLGEQIIRLFASASSVIEANQSFSRISQPSSYTWRALILANSDLKQLDTAIELYKNAQLPYLRNQKYIYLAIVRACMLKSSFAQGKLVHQQIICNGLQSDVFLGTSLVCMYAKCGCLEDARLVFDSSPKQSVVSYGAMITGYSQCDKGDLSLQCFHSMQCEGIEPDKVTFSSILKACGNIEDIYQGKIIHEQIIESSLQYNVFVGSSLIDMYAKCGSLEEAFGVFKKLPNRTVVSWNAIISGCAQQSGDCALECFAHMQHEGIYPDKITFSSVLKACGSIGAIEHGRHIHEQAIEDGVQLDIVVGNTLVDMYVKCHSLEEAHEIFLKLPKRDVVTWGSIIAAYAQHCDSILALKYLENMQQEGIKPAGATFLRIMKTCGKIGHLEQGRCIHVYIIGSGLRCDVIVGSTLVDMYAKCGSLEEACSNFARLPERNVVSWNAMIGAYAQDDEGLAALDCFHHMQHEGGQPDKVTFLCIFKACGSIKALECGRLIHEHVIQSGLHLDVLVGTALIDMYSKCDQLDEASKVFNELPNRNVISWGAIIDGYSQHDEGIVSLNYFNAMYYEGIKPDKVIFLCVLKACGSIGAIDQGSLIHEQIIQCGIESEAVVDNALINMYAKCGNMKDAQEIFKGIRRGDIVSWNAMVTGYAQIGEVGLAVQCFENMQYYAIAPDGVTFTAVLSACSHVGLMEEGYWYFTNMNHCFGVERNLIHHNSIIDLLGSFGCFKMAEDALKSSLQANISGLVALLAACRTHNNVELGSRCFYEVVHDGRKVWTRNAKQKRKLEICSIG